MASNSVPKNRANSAAVPVYIIVKKVDDQRTRNKVLFQDGEVDDEADESPLWFALCGVHGLLNDINAQLGGVTLTKEATHG